MATVKFANPIIKVSGKIAGNVFGRDKSGNRVRCMARRIKQRTPSQLLQRAAFRTCLNYMKTQSSALFFANWIAFAKRTVSTNKIGEPIHLHWRQWFMRFNLVRARNGLPLLHYPPE